MEITVDMSKQFQLVHQVLNPAAQFKYTRSNIGGTSQMYSAQHKIPKMDTNGRCSRGLIIKSMKYGSNYRLHLASLLVAL